MAISVELRDIYGEYNAGKLGIQRVKHRTQSVMVGSTAIKDAHGCSPIECALYDPKFETIHFMALAARWPQKVLDDIRDKVQELVDKTDEPLRVLVPSMPAPKFQPPTDYDED